MQQSKGNNATDEMQHSKGNTQRTWYDRADTNVDQLPPGPLVGAAAPHKRVCAGRMYSEYSQWGTRRTHAWLQSPAALADGCKPARRAVQVAIRDNLFTLCAQSSPAAAGGGPDAASSGMAKR